MFLSSFSLCSNTQTISSIVNIVTSYCVIVTYFISYHQNRWTFTNSFNFGRPSDSLVLVFFSLYPFYLLSFLFLSYHLSSLLITYDHAVYEWFLCLPLFMIYVYPVIVFKFSLSKCFLLNHDQHYEEYDDTFNLFQLSISIKLPLRSKSFKRLFGPCYSSDNSGDGPSQLDARTTRSRSRSQSANTGSLLNLTIPSSTHIDPSSTHSQTSIGIAVSDILSMASNVDPPIVEMLPFNLVHNSPVSQDLPDSQPALPLQQPLPDDDHQKLIDLDFKDFGVLISIVNSMTFIPEKFVKKVRSLYIKLMKKICDHPNDLMLWKKYFLLPTVLFTVQKGNRKEEIFFYFFFFFFLVFF